MSKRRTARFPMDRPDPVPEGEKSYIWIDAADYGSGFFVSLCLNNGVVYYCPPIVDYMVGWSREEVMDYCDNRGWSAEWEAPGSEL